MAPVKLPREIFHKVLGFALDGAVVKVHSTSTASSCRWIGMKFEYTLETFTAISLTYDDSLQALLDVEETKEDALFMAYRHATLDLTEHDLSYLSRFYGLPEEHVHFFRNVRATLSDAIFN